MLNTKTTQSELYNNTVDAVILLYSVILIVYNI